MKEMKAKVIYGPDDKPFTVKLRFSNGREFKGREDIEELLLNVSVENKAGLEGLKEVIFRFKNNERN